MSILKINLSRAEWLLFLTGVYSVISVMMNFLCMKPLSFGSTFIWMDGGLIVSWIVFLVSNVITEVYGKRTAIIVAGFATAVALFISIIAATEVYIPTLPEYEEQSTHFAYIFSNGPRTILSSALAFFMGNLVNVEIIDKMKKATLSVRQDNSRYFICRAVVSTIIGQMVDNGLFQILAFAPISLSVYEMRWIDIFTAIGSSTILETVVESFFVPFITIPLTRYLQQKI